MAHDLERDLEEMLTIASEILGEGRAPTPEERRRFLALKAHLDEQPEDWRSRLVDQIDRLAASLEGMGI